MYFLKGNKKVKFHNFILLVRERDLNFNENWINIAKLLFLFQNRVYLNKLLHGTGRSKQISGCL